MTSRTNIYLSVIFRCCTSHFNLKSIFHFFFFLPCHSSHLSSPFPPGSPRVTRRATRTSRSPPRWRKSHTPSPQRTPPRTPPPRTPPPRTAPRIAPKPEGESFKEEKKCKRLEQIFWNHYVYLYVVRLLSVAVKTPKTPPTKKADVPRPPIPTPYKDIPEPTSNIRDIIRKFNSRPEPEPQPLPSRSVCRSFTHGLSVSYSINKSIN